MSISNIVFDRYLLKIKLTLIKTVEKLDLNLRSALAAQIRVEKSALVNANSSISINLGMLNIIDNEHELACVLAHELSHRLLDIVNDPLDVGSIFGDIVKPGESEADKLGVWMAYHSGYDPYSLVRLLERIGKHPDYKRATPTSNRRDTHPPILERAVTVKEFCGSKGWKPLAEHQGEQYRKHVSVLYKKESVADASKLGISKRLESIAKKANVSTATAKSYRLKILRSVMKDLASFAKENPGFKAYFRQEASFYPPFLSGELKIEKPDWLNDDTLLQGKVLTAIEAVSQLLLSITPFVGDFIDLYEFLEGESFFDGSELDLMQRLLAGAGIIIGSRRIFEGTTEVAKGIKKDLELGDEAEKTLTESERIAKSIEELGWQGSKEAVADLRQVVPSLSKDGKLPGNYLNKSEAQEFGWNPERGNLHEVAPGKQIGGGRFANSKKKLPEGNYYEADIGYREGFRGNERIVFTEDGKHIYLTNDHYETFLELK